MDLSLNRLQGSLSDSFDGMDSLRRLDLSRNSFTGFLPVTLGEVPNLSRLFLQFNEFEGDVPNEYCDISTLEADCLPQPDMIALLPGETLPPQTGPVNFCVAYDCCTTCCDRVLGSCEEYVGEGGGGNRPPCDGFFDWDPETGEISGYFVVTGPD